MMGHSPAHQVQCQSERFERRTRMIHRFALSIAVLCLAGCVTTQGGGQQPSLAETLQNINPFDTKGIEFRKLVDSGQLDDAHAYFEANYSSYFKVRHLDEGRPATKHLVALCNWKHQTQFRAEVERDVKRLEAFRSVEDQSRWPAATEAIDDANRTIRKVKDDKLIILCGTGLDHVKALSDQLLAVSTLFSSKRDAQFAATFDQVVATGQIPAAYPVRPFLEAEYISSGPFQRRLVAALEAAPEAEREARSSQLQRFMASETKRQLVDGYAIAKAKAKIFAQGKLAIDRLPELLELHKQYGRSAVLDAAARVGFVDLTATSFRDRNLFDFEIEFVQDYGLTLSDAKDALLGSGNLSDFDFVFVADLSAAKVTREFKNKRAESSTTQTGTRQEPNPDYVTALSEYQQAMSQMQSTKLQNAVQGSQPCYGNAWGCGLAALLRGASDGLSQSAAREKAEELARTPQTRTVPVYSPYQYQMVDINAAKLTRVDYYVIDVRAKKVLSSYFEVKDHEKFLVSYNVEDADPNRSSILSRSQKEEDVTAWEKKPMRVRLSDLFDPQNLKKASAKPFTNAEAFLKPLATRKYVAAGPVYGRGAEPKTEIKGASMKSVDLGSGTIADERFDSVVMVKTSKAIGAGFYVTPELVLTAYHVVDGANLVELTYFDGTKSHGKVVDHDVRLDLALVKAQTAGKPVKIHSGAIKLGETAEAIGHPKGYEFTITRGVVSALRKQPSPQFKSSAPIEFIQTDTPISPGNSGGPLFLKDAVIGVNDWVRVDKASQNLNFSVSFNEIRGYLDRFEGKSK